MTMRTCIWRDEACDGVNHGRGLCAKHWQRAKKTGRLEEYPAFVRVDDPCEQVADGPCGTYGKYNQGCRGAECRDASAAYKRARRATEPVVVPDFSWLTGQPPCADRDDLFFIKIGEDVDSGARRWSDDGKNGHHARCVDPWAEARAICTSCPFEQRCLATALAYSESNQYGFVGGKDPWERRKLLKQRRKPMAA